MLKDGTSVPIEINKFVLSVRVIAETIPFVREREQDLHQDLCRNLNRSYAFRSLFCAIRCLH